MTEIHDQAVAVHRNGRAHDVEAYRPHAEVARWLIAYEMSAAGAPQTEPYAAEQACRKLLGRLARLITPRGCQALLARALFLAGAEFSFLRRIESTPTTETYVEGLGKSAAGIDPSQVHRGLTLLLGTLIGLVALFIGEHLMARMLLEVWPGVPVREPLHANGGL